MIGLVAQSFVFGVYTVDFILAGLNQYYPAFVEREKDSDKYDFVFNMLLSNLEYFEGDQRFFTSIFWLFLILGFCFLEKSLKVFESLFTLEVPEDPSLVQASPEPEEEGDLPEGVPDELTEVYQKTVEL